MDGVWLWRISGWGQLLWKRLYHQVSWVNIWKQGWYELKDKREKKCQENQVIYLHNIGIPWQTFKWFFSYSLVISMVYQGFKMCIQNAMHITDIIKDKCYLHSFAFFLGGCISHLNHRKWLILLAHQQGLEPRTYWLEDRCTG